MPEALSNPNFVVPKPLISPMVSPEHDVTVPELTPPNPNPKSNPN